MKKVIFILFIILCICVGIFLYKIKDVGREFINENSNIMYDNTISVHTSIPEKNKIDDWKLTLVNYENVLPSNFKIQLSYIDNTRKFDSRAISKLNEMLKNMKKDGIFNIWVQSAYRSIKYQEGLFNDKINTYINQGYTKEEAEELTMQTINKPGTSEHNLGLAVDFNYVDYNFENTLGFKWLEQNAENYGFILRYKKEKEEITKVNYEPWHWRYVGTENAKKINKLNMCLEEYIDYIKNSKNN